MSIHRRTRFAFFVLTSAAALAAVGVACSSSSEQDGNASNDDGGDANRDGAQLDGSANDAGKSDGSIGDAGSDSGRAEPSIQLALAVGSSCALSSGIVKCWGQNNHGQLGLGTVDNNRHQVPTIVPLPFTPTMIAMSRSHVCASNGTQTACWGLDNSGQFGDVDASACSGVYCPTPLIMNGLGPIRAFAAGDGFSCILGEDAGVSCFGDGTWGQHGPDVDSTMTPEPIVGLPAVAAIGAGEANVCARTVSGSIFCWGDNLYGELGQKTGDGGADAAGFDELPHVDPLQVPAINAQQMSVGASDTCVTLAGGTVSCWGSSAYTETDRAGQLGHDPLTDALCDENYSCDPIPSSVVGLSDVREVSAGGYATCAVRKDDTVVCWGAESSGELNAAPSVADAGETAYNFAPQVMPGLTNVAHIAAGDLHFCAVTWDNHVLCWGSNAFGEDGVPTIDDGGGFFSPTPVTPEGF